MYDFLFVIIELFSLALTIEALQGKTCQDSMLSGGVGHFEPRFQGEGVVPGEYFFGFYKTGHILLSDSAKCTMLHGIVLTQYRSVTDGQTNRRNCHTMLAIRALRHTGKTEMLRRNGPVIKSVE